MSDNNLAWVANFIWSIADDVLRDVYVRGKYRDVILRMTAIRWLDAVLEPTQGAVLKMKERLDLQSQGVPGNRALLCALQRFGKHFDPLPSADVSNESTL